MYYRCLRCNRVEEGGVLPGVSCGLYLALLPCVAVALLAAACYGLRRALLAHATFPPEPLSSPWWWPLLDLALVAALMSFLVVLVLLTAVALHYSLRSAEYLLVHLRRCPCCGSRRWSWGFRSGFGL